MCKQPEQALEDELVVQLQKLGHIFVKIKDETDLLANLKQQPTHIFHHSLFMSQY